jgi:hypothetical protein
MVMQGRGKWPPSDTPPDPTMSGRPCRRPLSGRGEATPPFGMLLLTRGAASFLAGSGVPVPAGRVTLRFLTYAWKHEGAWAQRPERHVVFRPAWEVLVTGRLPRRRPSRGGLRRAHREGQGGGARRGPDALLLLVPPESSHEPGGARGRSDPRSRFDLWPLPAFGQWTQVGKNATFGLGRYEIVGRDEEQS